MYNIALNLYAKGMFPWDWIFQKGSLNMHVVWYKMIKYAHGYKKVKREENVFLQLYTVNKKNSTNCIS